MGHRESLEARAVIVPINSHAKNFVRIKIDNLGDQSHTEAIQNAVDWRNEVKREVRERIAAEKAERERIAAEEAAREKAAREKAAAEKAAREKAEIDRLRDQGKLKECLYCGTEVKELNSYGMCSMACYDASRWS